MEKWKKFFKNLLNSHNLPYIILIGFVIVITYSIMGFNAAKTKIWLDFIQKLAANLLTWPFIVFLLSLKFKDSIGALILRVANIKVGENEISFREELKDIQASLERSEMRVAVKRTESAVLEDEFEQLVRVNPEVAVMQIWMDFERVLRDKFSQLVSAEKLLSETQNASFISPSEMLSRLMENQFISYDVFQASKKMLQLRNSIIHAQNHTISKGLARDYKETLLILKKNIEEIPV